MMCRLLEHVNVQQQARRAPSRHAKHRGLQIFRCKTGLRAGGLGNALSVLYSLNPKPYIDYALFLTAFQFRAWLGAAGVRYSETSIGRFLPFFSPPLRRLPSMGMGWEPVGSQLSVNTSARHSEPTGTTIPNR